MVEKLKGNLLQVCLFFFVSTVFVLAIITSLGAQDQAKAQAPVTAANRIYLPVIYRPYDNLKQRIVKYTLTLPHPLAGSTDSWCTWTYCSIGPRLYHEPLTGGGELVGWTDSSSSGHVSRVVNGNISSTLDITARSVRGLAAQSDGGFAVLLWDASAKIMYLARYNASNGLQWQTNIDDSLTSFNPGIGDSRLAYGGNRYAAYFAVHGDSGWVGGHEGDQLTYLDSAGAIQSGGWDWGCSHSMAELVGYNSNLGKFIPICSSDCFASKGILINDSQVVYPSDGNCGGLVSTQLGQVASSSSGWKIIFNAMTSNGFKGYGIGLASVDGSFNSSYTWLTHTNGTYERDPVLARLGSSLNSASYLAGWMTTNNNTYWLGLITGSGAFQIGPEEVSSAGVRWGNRDDSFRTAPDGSITWVQGDPGSSTLHLYRFLP